ncbi:MAG: pseudouridine synthase, partial [Candidatus Magasanikiibacteriota bacterium]
MESNFLLINKPKGWTSFDVVGYIRKQVREQMKQAGLSAEAKKIKVGHAGTLDPFATGLLIVGVGREATRRLDEFKNLPKTYIATIKLGAVSDTFDSTGIITEYKKPLSNCYIVILLKKIFKKTSITSVNLDYLPDMPSWQAGPNIRIVLSKFIGKQHQLPP